MFCFGKFCCICLSTKNKSKYVSIKEKCKDNVVILDKITICFKEFQNIITYVPDAVICSVCKGQVSRSYSLVQKIEKQLNVIKGYAEKLQHTSNKNTAHNLEASIHTNIENNETNKKKKLADSETDDNFVNKNTTSLNSNEIYYEIVPWNNNTEDALNKPEDNKYKKLFMNNDMKLFYADKVKIKQEIIDQTQIKQESSSSAKTESSCEAMDVHENESFEIQDEISICKEEFIFDYNSSPVNIRTLFNLNTGENLNETSTSNNEKPVLKEVENETLCKSPRKSATAKRRRSLRLQCRDIQL